MLHNYVTVYDSNVIITDYELCKLLSVTILIQIIPKILVFHPCYPYSKGCHSFHAMLLGISLKLHDLTVLATEKVSIKNEIMYTLQKSASWRQRNICAENNAHHARLITICQEMVTNVKSFTTTVPASHLVHRGWTCKSLTIYIAYAGRHGKVQSYEMYKKSLQTTCLTVQCWYNNLFSCVLQCYCCCT